MALALPKFRWLILGAVSAGIWVVREDARAPRPPERVPTWIERIVAPQPQPSKPAAAKEKADKPVSRSTAKAVLDRPVPPQPLTREPAAKDAAKTPTAPTAALLLPTTVDRPPSKPEKILTGSITRPDKPTFMQTKSKVFMRAQAKADAAIIATLEPRTVMRELARSGQWRLVMGDGRKGWVRADYLAKPTFLPRRPKLPVAAVSQSQAATKPKAQ